MSEVKEEKVGFDGKQYVLSALSDEAKKIVADIKQTQVMKVEITKELMRVEGVEQYLNAKLKEVLPKE